ncbi:hypothetical protein [Catenuloplanes japonicus]|uniref:hypothetical protein n=1 Tax=Catenuloplanes japonicus TaxID=33876 RepID=UPI0018DB715C|nr:hypothetical protein [Catenuloplanes japonicus]
MTFGHGIHRCLGQQLAWEELRVTLPALFARSSGLWVAGEATFPAGALMSGPSRLPVEW